MTPKEKAKELVDKFMAIKSMKLSDYSLIYYPFAKLCALIAVDELSKFLIDAESEDFNLPDEFSIQYWQEVKQEIENI